MDICPPAIATAAAFVAIILFNLYSRDWRRIPGHALFGVFAVLLMIFICQRASPVVGWILLFAPFLFVLFAWILRAHAEMTKYDKEPQQIPADAGNEVQWGCPCPCCGGQPCLCKKPCLETKPSTPKDGCKPKPKKNCESNDGSQPKPKPCNENSYFELWVTSK